jgi:hypothetical protein
MRRRDDIREQRPAIDEKPATAGVDSDNAFALSCH